MLSFENLNELKNFLQLDKDKESLNCVRFINVDSQSDWLEMKNFLATLTTNFIYLSDYCAEDTFPNLRKLRGILKNENKNICILPLSEFLRLNPEQAENLLKSFLNLYENEIYNFRIYFLMYRLKSFFLSLKITDPRQKECILLANSTTIDNYSLTIIQKSMPLKMDGKHVDGFKQYLNYWEKSPNETALTLYTENAEHLQDKKFFDDVKVIATAFDLLRYHYKLPAALKKHFGTSDYWKKLAELVAVAGNFESAFCQKFKCAEFGFSAFKNYDGIEKFCQWLLWLRCKLQNIGYISICANDSDTPEEFFSQIYEKIFSYVNDRNFEKFCIERREILSFMKTSPTENFSEMIRQSDKKIALQILTNNSQTEKNLFFEVLQKFRFNEIDTVRKILAQNFPVLSKYLSGILDGQNIFTPEQEKYFSNYRWLKVTNRITEDFIQRVKEISLNNGENIFSIESRNKIITEEYTDETAIFFVDGLGAEYLNFLAEEFTPLEENFSISYKIARCNLPSVTENNKDFFIGKKIAADILELDELKHSDRIYPQNILDELEFLSTLKEKFLNALSDSKKIIICADHGTSRLAVLSRQTEFDLAFPSDERKIYKSGRFAEKLPNNEKNFPTAIDYDDKIIFADYSRFIQKGSTGSEIHGGATLEEILVPIITIERREKNKTKQVKSSQNLKKIKRGISENKNFNI